VSFLRGAAFLAVVAALLAGCSGEHRASDRPYSAADLQWIKRLNRWEREYAEDSRKVGPVWNDLYATSGDVTPLRNVLRPYRECATRLRERVHAPENARLQQALKTLEAACEEDRQFALELVASFSSNNDQGLPSGDRQLRSQRLFKRADLLIENGLRTNRDLPVRGGFVQTSRIEPKLSRAASKLALKRVEIICWAPAEWRPALREWDVFSGNRSDLAGFANRRARANIAPDYCYDLMRFLYRDWRPASAPGIVDLADSVELVAHETEHLYNRFADEAETECEAVQKVRRLAVLLGASPQYGSQLSRTYWRELYPGEPPEYRTPECRKDGLYDEHPETSVFP
jgi:hypothetical protein